MTNLTPILEDITIECVSCGKPFIWTTGEQKFFQKMGFKSPRRCPICRKARSVEKQNRSSQQYEYPIDK